MKIIDQIFGSLPPPVLTGRRVWFAFTVAVMTDAIQLSLLNFGWLFADQVLDVIAFVLITVSLGFHILLLPTFVIEFLPVTDMLPTWTGCTAAVILLRKRAQGSSSSEVPPVIPTERPIDVASEVTPVSPDEPPRTNR